MEILTVTTPYSRLIGDHDKPSIQCMFWFLCKVSNFFSNTVQLLK